ncbi:MAG: hypothetical protein FD181_1129 [Prolixibacteraceae bacterium]|nr:MAG: hypothetical protein FD181_1129 [Prolixibacteraceae bacterium]
MTRKIISLIFHLLKTVFVFLVSAVILYFAAALVLSYLKTHPPKQDCPADKEIYITTNGVHLDIVMHMENLESEFMKKLEILPGTKYVSFGWGDKEFYLNTPEWKDLTFKTAFKALFLKSETAMHVTFYRGFGAHWKPLKLCGPQLAALNRYIGDSFKKNEHGKLQKIAAPGYYDNDAFYEATGSFSLFKTCNVWVNKALKEIGVPTSVWSPFDFGVLHHLPE